MLRKEGVQHNGSIFNKSVLLLAYVDDIDIIYRTKRGVSATENGSGSEWGQDEVFTVDKLKRPAC